MNVARGFAGHQYRLLSVQLLQGVGQGLCRSRTDCWVVQRKDLKRPPKVERKVGSATKTADDSPDKLATRGECAFGGGNVERVTLYNCELARECVFGETLAE